MCIMLVFTSSEEFVLTVLILTTSKVRHPIVVVFHIIMACQLISDLYFILTLVKLKHFVFKFYCKI